MAYRHLILERRDRVDYLTLNRPEVRNALNDEVIAELRHAATDLAARSDLRVVVLSGTGSVFSAGADVAWMSKTVTYSEQENLKDALALSQAFRALDTLPAPVIGRIQGAALGGGAGLAAVCDIVVAEELTVFGFTEVKLGIIPATIGPFVLAKIGRSAAREVFLTGERFTAQRARDIGLVHSVVPAGSLDDAVNRYVQELLVAGPEAVKHAKALIASLWGKPIDEAGPLSAAAIAARRVSAEGQEGLRAFLEKRKPSWVRD